MEFWRSDTEIIFFKTAEDGIDVAFPETFAGIDPHLLVELFAVACGESADRRAVDGLELAAWVVVVKHILGRKLAIFATAIHTFHNMDGIALSVKERINVTHKSPVVYGPLAVLHAG
jgi:hypothetical protein